MIFLHACSPHTLNRRLGAAFWLVCAMFLQTVSLTYHATAMAAGIEVCSAGGAARVDSNVDSLTHDKTSGHDCCCPSVTGSPARSQPIAPVAFIHAVPGEPRTAGRLGAEWLAPLSRGPPALFVI